MAEAIHVGCSAESTDSYETIQNGDLEFTEEDRKVLAKRIVGVFRSWKLSTNEQSMILGLPANDRSTINRYANGHPVAQNHDLLWRIGNILAIFRLLRSSEIDRPDRADKWITTPNPCLSGARPVDLMKNPDGVDAIRGWLEIHGAR